MVTSHLDKNNCEIVMKTKADWSGFKKDWDERNGKLWNKWLTVNKKRKTEMRGSGDSEYRQVFQAT